MRSHVRHGRAAGAAVNERFDIRAVPITASRLEADHGISRKVVGRARINGARLELADRIATALGWHVDELPRWTGRDR